MRSSKIERTDATWNPLTGCTKISEGCRHCYAERMALRLKAMGSPRYAKGFALTLHEQDILLPMSWKRPRLVFVNSMSDLFHEDVPFPFVEKVFQVMAATIRHRYQILTKRAVNLAALAPKLPWTKNIWMGVTVESRDYLKRIDLLRTVPACTRFLSCEPLLGPLGRLNLAGIHWVIVGGESGPGARVMNSEWVTEIRDQCLEQGVPFFFKQWGGVFKKRAGRELDGRTRDQMPRPAPPEHLCVV